MPAAHDITINLLGENQAEHTPFGRLVSWVTTYGRYIMVTTELIVLIAFLSRFSLDRTLTDLKDEISQKQEIIEVNQDLESDFRKTQDSLQKIGKLLSSQSEPTDTLKTLHTLLPAGTYFQSLSITNGKITAQVASLTVQSFSQFLLNVSTIKQLANVDIGAIDKQTITGIQYTLNAEYVPLTKK